jgi:hypothetical protein
MRFFRLIGLVILLGLGAVVFGFVPRLSGMVLIEGLALPWDTSVLMVGQSFGVNKSVPYYVRAFGEASEPEENYWLATPVDLPFLEGVPLDMALFEKEFSRVAPDVVVLMADYRIAGGPGGSLDMRSKLIEVGQRALNGGAKLIIVAHPPSAAERSISFVNKARSIERLIAEVATSLNSGVAYAGRTWAAVPSDQRDILFEGTQGFASREGERLIALSILAALDEQPYSKIDIADLGLDPNTADALKDVWPSLHVPAD